jgi:hypothetical protein
MILRLERAGAVDDDIGCNTRECRVKIVINIERMAFG